jgi:hypothetical protein
LIAAKISVRSISAPNGKNRNRHENILAAVPERLQEALQCRHRTNGPFSKLGLAGFEKMAPRASSQQHLRSLIPSVAARETHPCGTKTAAVIHADRLI